MTVPGASPPAGAAYGAAALAGLSALTTAYWTAGGTWLLDTVGGSLEDLARRADASAIALGGAVVVVELAGVVLALALVRPWGHAVAPVLKERTALVAGGLLAVYGVVLVVVGGVALTGALGPVADADALRWHVLLWDPWFLLWGALLVLAALRHRRLRRAGDR